MAITGRIPDDGRFVGHDFAENPIVLIAAPDDPLTKRRQVAVEELGSRSWLLREPGSGTRALSEEYLAASGLAPNLLTLGSNGAIKQAARAGLGIALQSRMAVELELELGLLATITPRGGLPVRQWHVVHAAAGPVRDEVEAFMRFCDSATARLALERHPGARSRASR